MRKAAGESLGVLPLSNWTELDVWQYIARERIPIVPLDFAADRPVVERSGTLIIVDDERMRLHPGEQAKASRHAAGIIQEMLLATTSERQGRVIDFDGSTSMELKKQGGYF